MILKKMILALSTSLFLLTGATGCSFVKDTVNAAAIAEDMNKVVLASNKTEELNKKVEDKMGELEKAVGTDASKATPESLKKAVTLLEQASVDAKAYTDEVKKLQNELSKLKDSAAKFDDAETKKLAEKFVADFTALSTVKVEYSSIQEVVLKEMKTLYEAMSAGKEPGNLSAFEETMKKFGELNGKYTTSLDQFNKSWEEFNKKVTGNKVE